MVHISHSFYRNLSFCFFIHSHNSKLVSWTFSLMCLRMRNRRRGPFQPQASRNPAPQFPSVPQLQLDWNAKPWTPPHEIYFAPDLDARPTLLQIPWQGFIGRIAKSVRRGPLINAFPYTCVPLEQSDVCGFCIMCQQMCVLSHCWPSIFLCFLKV